MRWEAIQGALVSLTIIFGMPLLRASSPEETAQLIQFASSQMHRISQKPVFRSGYRPKNKEKRQLYILQGLPGIGATRAENLLSTFGTIRQVVCASPEELTSVNGIGIKLAEKIHSIVS